MDKLRQNLHRLGIEFLKPHQKLNLLSTYIIPYFLHVTSLVTLPITTIRDMDPLIRTHVKGTIHLPASTPNGLVYCCKRYGDLGIPKLETLATSTALKQGIQLLTNTDVTVQALLRITKFEQRLERMAKLIRLQWPITNIRCICAHKRCQKAVELCKHTALSNRVLNLKQY